MTGALHTYLAVDDIANVRVAGLDGAAFLETAGGKRENGVQAGEVRIEGEVDRIYSSTSAVTLRDGARTLQIDKHGSASTIVWNPGPEKGAKLGDLPSDGFRLFLCVETANAPGAEVTLEPGAHQVLRTRIVVG
jgi:D-hexose-6-phosphate mutarotase